MSMNKKIIYLIALMFLIFSFAGCAKKAAVSESGKNNSGFPVPLYPNALSCEISESSTSTNLFYPTKLEGTLVVKESKIKTTDSADTVKKFYDSLVPKDAEVTSDKPGKYSYVCLSKKSKQNPKDIFSNFVGNVAQGDYKINVAEDGKDNTLVTITLIKSVISGKSDSGDDAVFFKIKNYLPSDKKMEIINKVKSENPAGAAGANKGYYALWTKDPFEKIKKYYADELKKTCDKQFQEKEESVKGLSQNIKFYNIYGQDKSGAKYHFSVSKQKDREGCYLMQYNVEW